MRFFIDCFFALVLGTATVLLLNVVFGKDLTHNFEIIVPGAALSLLVARASDGFLRK